MSARDRFVQTRKAIVELDSVKAQLDNQGEEWHPEGIHVRGISDPTAQKAIYNVDVLSSVLDKLRQREGELEQFIGTTLMIISRVAEGLGKDYAQILDQRYIDGLEWKDVRVNGVGINISTGKRKVSIACDWIDSLGLEKLSRGDFEI